MSVVVIICSLLACCLHKQVALPRHSIMLQLVSDLPPPVCHRHVWVPTWCSPHLYCHLLRFWLLLVLFWDRHGVPLVICPVT